MWGREAREVWAKRAKRAKRAATSDALTVGAAASWTLRALFRRELLPARIRWWFIGDGMDEWLRLLASELREPLGEARAKGVIAEAAASVWTRGMERLEPRLDAAALAKCPPNQRVGWTMAALYRSASHPALHFAFAEAGGVPRGLAEHRSAESIVYPLSSDERWRELTHHLGELLIDLTTRLPHHMPRANAELGRICFDAGVRVGKKMKKAFGLPATPASAIEVLRMSEYLFDVNPQHWSGPVDGAPTDRAAFLEGTACPWYSAPGWSGMHCGIFGQFQSGVSSVYGLRYQLTSTIPKHGGHTCRVDLKPIRLRRASAPMGSDASLIATDGSAR